MFTDCLTICPFAIIIFSTKTTERTLSTVCVRQTVEKREVKVFVNWKFDLRLTQLANAKWVELIKLNWNRYARKAVTKYVRRNLKDLFGQFFASFLIETMLNRVRQLTTTKAHIFNFKFWILNMNHFHFISLLIRLFAGAI